MIMPSTLAQAGNTRKIYKSGDLINYNGGKNSGLVLQVHEDYLKIINEQNKLANVKVAEIGK